jgi:hypothetical protein
MDKLSRFTAEQLAKLYEQLLEQCRVLPKIADVFEAARVLGLLTIEAEFHPHRWEFKSCHLCHGEGRLLSVWLTYRDMTPKGPVPMQRLVKLFGYSTTEAAEYKLQPGEYHVFARCSCPAGEAPTVSKAWPRWKANIEPVREWRKRGAQ